MKSLKTSRAGEPAGARTRCGTNPARSIAVIFWGDDEMGVRESAPKSGFAMKLILS